MSNLDEEFQEWLESDGEKIAEEIREILLERSDVLNVDDGSHAVWVEGDLGLLIVLPFEHAMAFAAESDKGDFNHSPIHNYVFATISELIMRATDPMSEETPYS